MKPSEQEAPKSEFVAKLEARWARGFFVCVGLDTDYSQIPESIKQQVSEFSVDSASGASSGELGTIRDSSVFLFNKQIVDATADLVCAYKPNAAFYEARGSAGIEDLLSTIKYIKRSHPEIPVILDAKRADIGNTNLGYVKAAFDKMGADAITVHPYLGREALQSFLDRRDKGIIVLAKTSNPGAGEFQDLLVGETGEPLYKVIARHVAEEWNENGNCALVVGATYPKELADVRQVAGDLPILIPGIGTQGGEVEATVKAGRDSRNMGMIINSSRGIIYASRGADFAEAARAETKRLTDEINRYRLAA